MDHRFNVCSSVDTEVAWLPLQFLLMVAYLKRLFSRPGNKGRSKTTAAINTLAQLRHIKDLAKKQCIASYQVSLLLCYIKSLFSSAALVRFGAWRREMRRAHNTLRELLPLCRWSAWCKRCYKSVCQQKRSLHVLTQLLAMAIVAIMRTNRWLSAPLVPAEEAN